MLTKNLIEGTWQALPVIIIPCELPDELKGLVQIDLTENSPRAWDQLIRRLTGQEPVRERPSRGPIPPTLAKKTTPRPGTIAGVNLVLLVMFFLFAFALPKPAVVPVWLQHALVAYTLFCTLHGINWLVTRSANIPGKFTLPILNIDIPAEYLGSDWILGNLWRAGLIGVIGMILVLLWWQPGPLPVGFRRPKQRSPTPAA